MIKPVRKSISTIGSVENECYFKDYGWKSVEKKYNIEDASS